MADENDGLPIPEVGEWVKEKHERLRQYVGITRSVQKRYTVLSARSPHEGTGGATYIDLFCGPGCARIEKTGELVDGSPVLAFKAAVASKFPFSEIHIADLDPANCHAAAERIVRAGGQARCYIGRAEETAKQIVRQLNPYGFHFAFLDPYNLESLSFDVIKELAALKHIDLLVHVSVQDLQRNLARYIRSEHSPLDVFTPGWRSNVDVHQSPPMIRAQIHSYWRTLLGNLGFLSNYGEELVTGNKGQRLYWLVLLSRRQIAHDFWDKVRHISGQGDLLSGI